MGVKEQYRDYVMTGFVKRVEPVVADHGDGARLYDADGTEYIDCFAGISVTNAGHHNTKVLDAAKAQADKLVHACSYVYHVPSVGALAEKLAQITPGKLQKSFFGNGGAEAIEGAFRLAKRSSGRREFLAIESSFHGRSFATLSVTGNSGRKKGGGPYMPGVAFVPTPYCYRCFAETTPDKCDLLCARRVAEIARLHLSGDVCAFIAEPVMGEGGIIVPPDGYFKKVKEFLDEDGILFIADEVQSGFGRTGKMFGIEHYGVDPDIMCMAKGIADGWPLSAFTAKSEIAEAFQVGDHLSTFGGNPVSCAAALANIEFLESGVIAASAKKGADLKARFETLAKTQPLIGDVRGKGLMIGVELVADQKTRAYGTAAAGFVRQYCLEHNVLIGVGGNFASVLRVQPPPFPPGGPGQQHPLDGGLRRRRSTMDVQPNVRPEAQPQVRHRRPARRSRGRPIVAAVLAVIIFVFILQNSADTQLSFLWLHFTWPAWLAIILTLVVGVIVGLLVGAYARRPKKR